MKKIGILIVLATIIGLSQASSLGVGVAGGLPIGEGIPGSNVILSIKPTDDKAMPLIGVGFLFDGSQSITVLADWWLIQETLTGSLGVYVGVGAYVAFVGNNGLALGGRVPVGLNIFPLKWLELFVEIDPALGYASYNGSGRLGFGLQSAFGVRFWFK